MKTRLPAWAYMTLRDPEPGNEGGSGGGGEDKSLTKEEITTMINGAQKAWGDRITKDIEGKLDAKLEPFKGLGDQLTSLKDAIDAQGQGGGKGKGAEPSDLEKEVLKLKGATESLQQKLDIAESQKQELEQKTQRAEERAALEKALTDKGVTGGALAGAVALLIHDRKVLSRDDEGAIVYKVQKEAAGQKYDENVSVADGVSEFLKSTEGKAYLPSREVAGSGGGKSHFGGSISVNSADKNVAKAAETVAGMLNGGGMGIPYGEASDPRK